LAPFPTKRRTKHDGIACLLSLLDVVVSAWPFDGMLGIGEGACAAALVTMLVASDQATFDSVFEVLAKKKNKTGGEEEARRHSARVERQRACLASMRGGDAENSTTTTQTGTGGGTETGSCGRLLYTILVNGRMTRDASAVCKLVELPRPSVRCVPSLHVNVRTRQQRVVGNLTLPLSSSEQEASVLELHAMFQSAGAPTTLVTPVVGGADGIKEIGRRKKKRKLSKERSSSSSSSSSSPSSSPSSASCSEHCEQPGVSIRNIVCIDAMRTFLHRCSLDQ
jgi:hypothetical protein